MKGKYVNFSVFQLFGDNSFLEYLKINLELKILLFDYIFMYPKTIDIFVENLLMISDCLLDILFNNLDVIYISHVLMISFKLVK